MDKSELYNQLTYFTLELKGTDFVHQLVVDTWAAQNYDPEHDKAIKITFSLIGLYLVNEKGYTGRQVQLVHIKLGKHKRDWPKWEKPDKLAVLTIQDVLAVPDDQKVEMIKKWSNSVWQAWIDNKSDIEKLLSEYNYL